MPREGYKVKSYAKENKHISMGMKIWGEKISKGDVCLKGDLGIGTIGRRRKEASGGTWGFVRKKLGEERSTPVFNRGGLN